MIRTAHRRLAILLLVVVLAGTWAPAHTQTARTPLPADAILFNAKIYTVNRKQPWAEALALGGSKILAVGRDSEMERYRGAKTKIINARGHLVLPGFTDSHIHFIEGSLALRGVQLQGTQTIAEIQERLKKYAAAHPGTGWILGQGWIYNTFGASALPDKKYLDEFFSDRPVFLTGFDLHSYWANSKALELAGITRDTPDPLNGKIVRDPKSGDATGALEEDAAGNLIKRAIPEPARPEMLAALRQGMAEASRAGLVRVVSTDDDFEHFDLYEELVRNEQLSVRMLIARRLDPPELTPTQLNRLEQERRQYHDDWISAGTVKFYLDGVVEMHTAAMLAPYSDDPNQVGVTFWQPEKYKQAVTELDRRGFQIFTHAIGDRAVRLALDAYEQAHKATGTPDARDRIEHIETISKEDIARFGRLGVIASMQPLHANPDEDNAVWVRNVGPERETRAFAWHSIERAGGRLAFGSDWPVVTLSPWEGIRCAITRQTQEGRPPGGWVPQQRVTLTEAIEAYTLGAAFASRREKTEGSLEPGKVADLIVLSHNLFDVDAREVGRTQVLLTMVGGKVVYQAPGWGMASGPAHAEAAR